MRFALAVLLVLIVAGPASARRKRGSHPELCELRTVFVDGNSESANKVREEIPKRTWLKLAGSKEQADAVLAITETKSTGGFPMTHEQTSVSGQISKPGSSELLWSDTASFGEGPLGSGAGSAAKILLNYLAADGNCKP